MTPPRVRRSVLLLAVVVLACGGEEKPPPPPPPPVLSVVLEGPEKVHCSASLVTGQATITGGVADTVTLFKDGQRVGDLVAPYQYSLDCAAEAEGRYALTVQATLQGRSFTSAPRQLVVDRTRPSVIAGPFAGAGPEIAKDAPVRVTFTEPMKTAPVVPASIYLAGGTVKALSWSEDQTTLTVELQPVIAPQSFTLSLRTVDFQDLAGNPLSVGASKEWSWTIPGIITSWRLPTYGNGVTSLDPPALARDHSGQHVVAWLEYTQARGAADVYVHRSRESGETLLGGPLSAVEASSSWVEEVEVAVDALNRPVVAWIETVSGEGKVFVRRWEGQRWEELGGVPDPVIAASATNLALATGHSDLPVIAWREVETGPKGRVYVYRWNGSAWGAVGAPIEARAGTGSVSPPALVIDGQDRPVLSVSDRNASGEEFTEEAIVRRWSGTAWEQIGSALRPLSSSSRASVGQTSLALDSQGRPALAFELETSDGSFKTEVYFARHGDAGWSTPELLSGPSSSSKKPSVGFDSEGAAWVAWMNEGPPLDRAVHLRKAEGGSRVAVLSGASHPVFANGGVGAPSLLVVDGSELAARLVRHQ